MTHVRTSQSESRVPRYIALPFSVLETRWTLRALLKGAMKEGASA